MATNRAIDKLIRNMRKKQEEADKDRLAYVPERQLQTITERIESSDRGEDTKTGEEIRDKRNAVEKALNLTPDQNVIFDVFEILDRPQKALFAGMQSAIKGDNVLEGAADGLTGENKLTFKNVLGELGFDEEEFITKALGFAGDVFIDPLSVVKFGGATKAARLKVLDDFHDATLAVDSANEALKAYTVSKNVLDKDTLKLLDADLYKAIDAQNKAFEAYQGLRKNRTASEWIFTGAKTGIKKGATVVDGFTSTALGKIDEIKKAKMLDVGMVAEVEKHVGMLDKYKSFKEQIQTMFNINKTLPKELLSKSQEIQGRAANARTGLSKKLQVIRDDITEHAAKMGTSVDDLDKNILFFEEFTNYKAPDLKSLDALIHGNLVTRVGVNKSDADLVEHLLYKSLGEEAYMATVGKYGQDKLFKPAITIDGEVVYRADKNIMDSIKGTVKELEKIEDKEFIKNFVAQMELPVKIDPIYTKDQIALADALSKDEQFLEIYDRAMQARNDMASIIDYELDTLLLNSQIDGYMRHSSTDEFNNFINSDEYKLARKHMGEFKDEALMKYVTLSGNTQIMKNRDFPASIAEINTMFKKDVERMLASKKVPNDIKGTLEKGLELDVFQDTFTSAMEDYIIKVPDTVEKIRTLEESMIYAYTKEGNFLRPYNNVMEKIPYGYDVLDKDALIGKLKSSKAYMSYNKDVIDITTKHLEETFKDVDKLLISENLNRMIGVLGTDKSTIRDNPILNVVNALTNMFKKLKLSNIVGTQSRNVIGNTTNLMLGGMSAKDIAYYTKNAHSVMSKADDLFMKRAKMGAASLTRAEKEILDTYESFVRKGFQRELSVKMLESTQNYQMKFAQREQAKLLGKSMPKMKSPSEVSTLMNAYMDDMYRLSAFMYADANPQKYLDLGLSNPAEYVRFTMFDPDALTPFERNTMRQFVPFYTFSKLNLQYHTKNIVQNTDKYRGLRRVLNSAWDNTVDDTETQVEDFKKENMWIPLFHMNDNGEYYAVKANLPANDFFNMMTNPLGESISKLSPFIKAPAELAMNRDFFSGREIEAFKGQQDYQMPELSAKAAYGLRQTGLDVPVKAGYDIYSTIARPEEDATPLDHLVSAVFNPILNKGHTERAERRKAYQELDKLKDAVQLYNQKGYYINTLREARNSKATKRIEDVISQIKKRANVRR